MNYATVCSGIGSPETAWSSLGWKAQWCSEIEKFPSRVLKHHYPDVPNLGDMTKITTNEVFRERSIDLLCGGTPCQSFSIAGLRKGMADPRGNLALVFLGLVDATRPRWVVWENVPGVLSSSEGRDFGSFLGGLAELGYGFAYRVLDAQYVRVDTHARAVPQRRRRVFVVGHIGDWRPAAQVLFERQSLSGDSAPSRKKRQGIARGFEIDPNGGRFTDLEPTMDQRVKNGLMQNQVALGIINQDFSGATEDFNISPTLTKDGTGAISDLGAMLWPHEVAQTLDCTYGSKMGQDNQHINGGALFVPGTTNGGNFDEPILLEDQGGAVMNVNKSGVAQTLRHEAHGHEAHGHEAIVFQEASGFLPGSGATAGTIGYQNELAPTLRKCAQVGAQVRRLTPRECERLQGFPADFTAIPGAKDGPRYKALGNSMAVNVMRWIGLRIQMVENKL